MDYVNKCKIYYEINKLVKLKFNHNNNKKKIIINKYIIIIKIKKINK